MTTTPKYPVECQHPPVLLRSADGKQLFAAGGGAWIPVPDDTTMANIHLYMRKKERAQNLPIKRMQVKIKDKAYKVEVWKDKSITCECTGFRFRKSCKHVQAVQKMVNSEKQI